MTTRRDFVRALARAGTVGGVGTLPGCRLEERIDTGGDSAPSPGTGPASGSDSDSNLAPLDRPLLRPWADDIAWIAAPSDDLPVAYVSMSRRRVYVDHDYRDRAAWLLDAHISVSTAHWRIPLPGDSPGIPITPGDSAREFEEFAIREWDASDSPALDDIRILRGSRVTRTVAFACVPMAGGEMGEGELADGTWYRAGPWGVDVVAGGVGDPEGADTEAPDVTREDFRIAGAGWRFSDRECTTNGDAVQFVMWSCRDAAR